MKNAWFYYDIVTSMSELCRWLNKKDIQIIDIVPTKGIANEDIVEIRYFHKED